MKVTVYGYTCPASTPEEDLPEPAEVCTFEGDEVSVEMEVAAFAVRFKWIKINVEEK